MSRTARQWTLAALKEECTVEVGDCWEWQRSMSGPQGRQPQINAGGKPQSAFRLAYALHKGKHSVAELPLSLCVWRTCLNLSCINPAHLKAGTRAEKQAALAKAGVYKQNALMRMKLRDRPGRKLNMQDARRIRASTDPVKVITEREGVSAATVISIRTGRTWSEVPRSADPLAQLAAVWHVRPSANDQEEDEAAA